MSGQCVAALPRIVTLHDIAIASSSGSENASGDELVLNVTAKTYRYLEDEDEEDNAG